MIIIIAVFLLPLLYGLYKRQEAKSQAKHENDLRDIRAGIKLANGDFTPKYKAGFRGDDLLNK